LFAPVSASEDSNVHTMLYASNMHTVYATRRYSSRAVDNISKNCYD
jgi:hypothetical protein